jgi:hypothetical protein
MNDFTGEGLRSKNDCTGEEQQQFTSQSIGNRETVNYAMCSVGSKTKNRRTGEDQQQFTRQAARSVFSCIVGSNDYLTNRRVHVCCSCSDLHNM